MTALTILTDGRIIAIAGSLISLLASGLFFLVIYFVRQMIAEQKENRLQLVKFNLSFSEKVGEIDTVHAVHEQKIDTLHDDVREQKEKIAQHASTLSKHEGKFESIDFKLRGA